MKKKFTTNQAHRKNIPVREEELLHFGDVEPANRVHDGEEECEPGERQRVAVSNDTARADHVEQDLQVEAVGLALLVRNLAVIDGHEKEIEHDNDRVEHTRGECGRHFFGDGRCERGHPGDHEKQVAYDGAAGGRVMHANEVATRIGHVVVREGRVDAQLDVGLLEHDALFESVQPGLSCFILKYS